MDPSAPQDDSDDGMDMFMDAFKTHKYMNAFSESNWEEEFDKMPIFMKTSPGETDPCLQALIDDGTTPEEQAASLKDDGTTPEEQAASLKDDGTTPEEQAASLKDDGTTPEEQAASLKDDGTTPEEQAASLKDDGTTPEEQAASLKDDGNVSFKEKDYRKAIASYTEGLKKNCGDLDIDAVLLTNRAAAHFHLGNARSALSDATSARKLKPGHLKALVRGARCCVELRRFAEAVRWCDAGLEAHPADAELLEMRTAAGARRRAAERDARKADAKEKKDRSREEDLLTAIRRRGIELLRADDTAEDGDLTDDLLGSREAAAAAGARVFLDERGALCWPVLFLYPEHRQSDVVSAFCESERFSEHLAVMFGGEVLPPWDADRKYRPQSLRLFLDDREKETLYRVDPETSLLTALQHQRCVVKAGTPSFIVLVEGSTFCKHFLTGKTVKRL